MTRRSALAAVCLTSLVAACTPQPMTSEGSEVASLYVGFMVTGAIVGLIVIGLTTYAALRYRRRTDALPVQTRGNLAAELIWTVLPALTVAGLFAGTIVVLDRVEGTEREPGVEVSVTAFRWGWTFTYPDEGITISGIGVPGPEIVVPVGEPIRFDLTAGDVQHAFFVPAFLTKRDAYPGRVNVLRVTIDEPGTYRGQCAEYCGLYHSKMPFAVHAVSRAEYDAWIAANRGMRTAEPLGSPLATEPVPTTDPTDPAQSLGAP